MQTRTVVGKQLPFKRAKLREESSFERNTGERIPTLRSGFTDLWHLLLFSFQKDQERKKTD